MHILLGIFAFIAVATVASTHLIVKTMFEPKLTAAHLKFAKFSPRILRDMEYLRQNPLFDEFTHERNAASNLEFYMSFEGGQPVKDADRVRDLFLRYPYWKKTQGDLKKLMEDPDFKSIDTEWVNQLYKFDHWQLTSHAVWGDALRDMAQMNGLERTTHFAAIPLPNYNELRQWATLNFLKMQQAGRPMPGMHAFRKMVQLIHTSGTLVGNMVVYAMLKDEEFLVEKFKVSGWQPAPPETSAAYRRVSWAWPSVAREAWFGNFPKAFEPYMTPELGICVLSVEPTQGIPAFQDFLEPKFLFETSYVENIRRLRDLQYRIMDICRTAGFKTAFGPTDPKTNPWIKEDQAYSLPLGNFGGLNYSRIPFLRRVLGMILMTVSVPYSLKVYEEPETKAAD